LLKNKKPVFLIKNYAKQSLALQMTTAIPIFRIFDYQKAIEFYIDWLGFTIDWKHNPDDTPIYLQISLNGIVIHGGNRSIQQ